MTRNKENNLVRVKIDELENLGYKQPPEEKDKKGNFLPPPADSFLCLSKEKDLWAELTESDIKHAKLTTEKGKFLILSKNNYEC